jgi:cellobiose-specific phosphotransferase system component IIC
LAVEDISLNAIAVLQRQRHVAAIVEGLLQSLPQVFFAGQIGALVLVVAHTPCNPV